VSRFPFRRFARKRKAPPPEVPHIIYSMDSRLYPLVPTGTGAEMTAWPPAPRDVPVHPLPPYDTLPIPDVPPIPYRPRSPEMPDHTAEQPAVQDQSESPTETDLRMVAVPTHDREVCRHCRGSGYRMSTNDLLRESIALLEGSEDEVIRRFYEHLLRQAPDLALLFPSDLIDPMSPVDDERTGRRQRDKLVAALAALANSYDPGVVEKMEVLDTHLAAFGRAHAAFRRPDGAVRGATVSEYHAVKVTLFATLHDAAGEAWLPEYDTAWDEAYEYAARHMLAAQDSVDRPFGRYPRS
jgi:hemoglobin-like flavoprotein